ncbi:hypothetical protein Q4551_05890 [Oceanobacter sp. 5_MG-2023]|uniref:hypothetical protein n=1 Tax=Oceanobacter sp. 5_MG-2023 TaxID=3062645 RepID=UPI0026E4113A|nr:hypothetical protein [Oceanobacter sp. 5_MG-2023]MDO6681811.1 hypothetical protein [Oceanobacter sp. 5_MG-2023]
MSVAVLWGLTGGSPSVQAKPVGSAAVSTDQNEETAASAALAAIRQDLAAGRLSQPAVWNAMVRIDEFRRLWPTNMAVVPLAYQWAAAYQQQVEDWLAQGELAAAAMALEQLWTLVPLSNGLDRLQHRLDRALLLQGQTPPAFMAPGYPLSTAGEEETPVVVRLDYRPLGMAVHDEFRSHYEDNSPPLAEFLLDANLVELRDQSIQTLMAPLCQAIVDNQASVIVHAEDRVDYRWLTVRITLCVRRINEHFRLRHSYQQQDGAPMISLHPARAASLLPAPE